MNIMKIDNSSIKLEDPDLVYVEPDTTRFFVKSDEDIIYIADKEFYQYVRRDETIFTKYEDTDETEFDWQSYKSEKDRLEEFSEQGTM